MKNMTTFSTFVNLLNIWPNGSQLEPRKRIPSVVKALLHTAVRMSEKGKRCLGITVVILFYLVNSVERDCKMEGKVWKRQNFPYPPVQQGRTLPVLYIMK